MLLKSLLLLTLQCSCGLTMRLPDDVYFTSPSAITEQEALESGIRTDLVAPSSSSLSQYYQQPNYHPNHNYFEQQAQLSPFLYKGPLIMMVGSRLDHHQDQSEIENTERNSQNQEKSSYDLYRPSWDEKPEFVDMVPPAESQEENYYAVKPKKTKKYSSAVEKKKYKKHENLKAKIVKLEDYDELEVNQEEPNDQALNYGEIPITQKLVNESESLRQEREAKDAEETASVASVEASAPSSRLDFQMHGHKGPKTYKFGFDTGGTGKNRQFKVEEKDADGNVYGQYGYYEDTGKLRIVKYASMKNDGFKVLS